MGDRLLRSYRCCFECLRTPRQTQLTKEHVIPRALARRHWEVLHPLLGTPENLIDACWPGHVRLERKKREAYKSIGITGLVVYIASIYPRSPDPEMEEVQDHQFGELLFGIAHNIEGMTSDPPVGFRTDYETARERALYYGELLIKGKKVIN